MYLGATLTLPFMVLCKHCSLYALQPKREFLVSDLLQSVFSNLCCWSSSWWGSRRCLLHGTKREHGEAAARPEMPADKTRILAWTTNWNTKNMFSCEEAGWKIVLNDCTENTGTREWASFPECRPGTGDDLCGQDTSTLHGDRGSSDSSSCWTKCLAPQTLTFPEHKNDLWSSDWKPSAWTWICTQYLQNCVY